MLPAPQATFTIDTRWKSRASFRLAAPRRGSMRAVLLLLSASLLLFACAEARYASRPFTRGQPETPCADVIRDTSAPGATYGDNRCANRHLGEIHAVCAGETPETCTLKHYLSMIDEECKLIEAPCPGADELLRSLFDGTRHTKFANYIIYFDQNHTPGIFHDDRHRSVLMWNRQNTRYLYGAQEVYILVFSEYKFCLTAQATTIFRNEPNPLQPLLKLLGRDTGVADTQIGLKTQQPATFIWYPLSGDPANPVMWLAIGSVATDVNTTDWVTVRFKQPDVMPDKATSSTPAECIVNVQAPAVPYTSAVLAHNAFFSDNRASGGGLAVAFGATIPRRKLASEGVASPTFDGFVLAKYYVKKPTLRSDPNTAPGVLQYASPSVGIAIGTNVGFGSAPSFNQVVGAVSIGHLSRSNVGTLIGVSYFLPPKPTPPPPIPSDLTKRHLLPFIGVEYSF